MSDDNSGDVGMATPADQDAVIDRELDILIETQFIGNYAMTGRRVYDGLIRAARKVRDGRALGGDW